MKAAALIIFEWIQFCRRVGTMKTAESNGKVKLFSVTRSVLLKPSLLKSLGEALQCTQKACINTSMEKSGRKVAERLQAGICTCMHTSGLKGCRWRICNCMHTSGECLSTANSQSCLAAPHLHTSGEHLFTANS